MKYSVTVNGETFEVEVQPMYGGTVRSANSTYIPAAPAKKVAPAPAAKPAVKPAAKPAPQPVAKAEEPKKAEAAAGSVVAPMPGNVLDIKVAVGDQVNSGDVVMLLEAMKMEIEVVASASGKVKSVTATKGAAVNTGDVLVVLE